MPFLRNAWYPAGWAEDLTEAPLARTFLGEPIVLFRDAAGEPAALADQCPHRFAPLSMGRVEGDTIRCPYHGLVFDRGGACVHNPHGKGARPAALNVRSYPLRQRDGMIWIWMGDAEGAAASEPPSFPFLEGAGLKGAGMRTMHGYLHVQANYELVTDNLMDLSHAEFLHPFIMPEGTAGTIAYRAEVEGERVGAIHEMLDQPNTPLFALVLGEEVKRIDGYANSYWEAPANIYLETCATSIDVDAGRRAMMPQAHLLTPETEFTTHYFWGISRDRGGDNPQLDGMLRFGIDNAFVNEDEPMIRAVAERMRNRPLFEMSPALLPMDEAAVRVRRILANRIAKEAEAA